MNNNWQKLMESQYSPVTPLMDLIKYPVITEKSYLQAITKMDSRETTTDGKPTASKKKKQYTFNVDLRLTKPQIKKLFENIFSVNIIGVNSHIPPRKKRRSLGTLTQYKTVIITLKEGQSINFNLTR
jgi:large subunit ribosomal protein L23